MTTTTTAAVLRSAEEPFELAEITLPDPRPDEALVRVVAAGLCHTDLLPRHGSLGRLPIVLGHETAGIVEATGGDAVPVRPGDHVVASFHRCGRCAHCRAGSPPYCDSFWALNFSGAPEGRDLAVDGAGEPVSNRWFGQSSFAGYALVPVDSLVVVDPALPLDVLAPLGCSVLTGAASILRALDVRPGSSVAVFGVGAVGLSAVMAARLAGAATVCAVDRNGTRLAAAERLGATDTVPADGGLRDRLRAVTGGFDYCLDTTGVPEVISAAVDSLTATGRCGLLGSPRGPLTLGRTALAGGRSLRGLLFGDADPGTAIPELIERWQDGGLPFDTLITRYPLSAVNDAEADFRAGTVVKPVLLPR